VLSSSDNESEILLYQRKEEDLERINNLWVMRYPHVSCIS
jgi:hypothetical protein